MSKLRHTLTALLSAIALTGCGIPEPVAELMDSQSASDGAAAFSTTERLEEINASIVHREQPPPL